MFQTLKSFFSGKEPVNYKEVIQNGASLIDVRTPAEYNSGTINGARNIPLQNLKAEIGQLSKQQPVVVFCATGARSSTAKRILESHGFEEVYNGGGWKRLNQQLK